MKVTSLPALSDNYIHIITDSQNESAANSRTRTAAVVVDPGDSAPVLKKLHDDNLDLETILITHKHADHIDGIGRIIAQHPQAEIIAPNRCPLPAANNIRIVSENDSVKIFGGASTLTLSVIHTPGHTLEHIAFFGGGLLFCGDTLFPCGCGRVFEGTFAEMLHSIDKLIELPPETRAYCGHEYTAKNIAFAKSAEPNNPDLPNYAAAAAAKLKAGLPTSPFTIAEERACNPFARVRVPSLIAAVYAYGFADSAKPDESPEAIFESLRRRKDNF